LKAEWVADKAWTYKVALPKIEEARHSTVHVLAFDGLDTFATVKLNGKVILESDNMFIPHRVEITKDLKPQAENTLEIDFKSARLEAIKIREAHPEHTWVGFNGDMSRLAVRKAQYHWGWDWGPILNTCGPWREVRLETYQARVEDVRVDYKLDDGLKSVQGTISAVVEGSSAKSVTFKVQDGDKQVFKETAKVNDGFAKVEFHVNNPKLWYPHGYGEQPLYQVTATVSADEVDLHSITRRTGFRKGELVQQPDKIGKTFFLRINDVDVFCGGSDWIPADNFTPRITEDKYRKWLEMMVDGYQVMIRVWGGGIWEEDIFYELCDELGILVWQDFMFGCGNYPAFPEILKSIKEECISNVARLRHHPALVIYAGNNEDYQVQESFGLTYNYEDKDPDNWLKTDFPARYIYEKVIGPFWIQLILELITYFADPPRSRCSREPTYTIPPRFALGRRPEDVQHYSWRHASMERLAWYSREVSNFRHTWRQVQ
jgi:beta-mannosidase